MRKNRVPIPIFQVEPVRSTRLGHRSNFPPNAMRMYYCGGKAEFIANNRFRAASGLQKVSNRKISEEPVCASASMMQVVMREKNFTAVRIWLRGLKRADGGVLLLK